MGTTDLCKLLAGYWSEIEAGLDAHTLLEIDRRSVATIVHRSDTGEGR